MRPCRQKMRYLKLEHRKEVEAQVIELIQGIPQTQLLLSIPGIGPRLAAQILMTVGDISDCPTAGHLASYAGLSPRTNQSGTSIMSNSLNRSGNKKLKTPYGNRFLHRSDSTSVHGNPTNENAAKAKGITQPLSP
ncbi:transposase [Corynebacterium kutscheri]|uniref:transposase n=1 Tax=Corynebacterium kutscheri TaxID=35755 RepID=UPI0038B351FF